MIPTLSYLALYPDTRFIEDTILNINIINAPIFEDIILNMVQNTFLEKNAKKYILIYNYANSNNYNENDKIKILSKILNEDITFKDLQLI